MGQDFTLSIDPLWFRFGILSMRYYTALFFMAIVLGYLLWRWQTRRAGYPPKMTRTLAMWGIPAVLIGARLAHCFIYEPGYYLTHPLEIPRFWQGGLASHGVLAVLPVVLFVIARKFSLSPLDLMDRFTFSAALGATLVRVGNFFNSEIVGRETAVPWGIRFLRFDGASKLRHPTQLYEAAVGIAVLLLLFAVDRWAGRERRPRGLLTGLFLTVYFGLRFLTEYTKAYLTLAPEAALTMGQILSIFPMVIGGGLLVRVFTNRRSG